MAVNGTVLFARYAFMPNRLGYCGGDDNRTLFEYCAANQTDPGLVFILQKFQAAYPYLKLIAESNGIADPFHAKVVEAYWLGNELLDRVDLVQFYDSLRERFGKQLSPKTLGYLLGKPTLGARPFHAFHVFDVHSRVGTLENSLDTIENCRIGWGRVKESSATQLVIEHQPVVLDGHKLKLGERRDKTILRQFNGAGFIKKCQAGDFVSCHWNWACDVLTPAQVRSLERNTRYHLELANQTM